MRMRVVHILIVVILGLSALLGGMRLVLEVVDRPKGVSESPLESGGRLLSISIGTQTGYLLPCTGGYLLIDTGYPGDYAHFLDALKHLGVDVNEIRYILLTHHHDDHSGFAAALRADTGAKLIVHGLAVGPLSRGAADESVGMKMEPYNFRVLALVTIQKLLKGRRFTFPPVTVSDRDYIIAGDDSDVLRRIGIDGSILYTTGHTPDSISVLLDDGKAFCGDVAMNFLSITGIGRNPIYSADRRAVRESWAKLIDGGATRIFPTHGTPFDAAELQGG
jgi:glyoxylase-like metal-dependent hydrolase (beta-lactamase superfamily II)